MDEGLKSRVHKRMVETGEWDRVRKQLEEDLQKVGWQNELYKYCVKVIRDRGVENITLDHLLTEVTPVARKNVPKELEQHVAARVRSFLSKELHKPT